MSGPVFRLDLNDLRQRFSALGALPSEGVPTVPVSSSPWNAWLQGTATGLDDSSAGADHDGHIYALAGGVSYRLTDDVTAGIVARYRKGEMTSTALASKLESDFFSGGVFAQAHLFNGIRLDSLVSFGRGDNDIAISGATGNFYTDSMTMAGKLSRRWYFADWWLEPNASIIYSNSDRDGYTNSAGTAVASATSRKGRIAFGPRIGFSLMPLLASAGVSVKQADFELGLNGVWQFTNRNTTTLSTGVAVSDPELSSTVSSDLNLVTANGVSFGFGIDYLRQSSLNAYSGRAKISVPLN